MLPKDVESLLVIFLDLVPDKDFIFPEDLCIGKGDTFALVEKPHDFDLLKTRVPLSLLKVNFRSSISGELQSVHR
jgi:hypothetical protein